MYGVRMEICNSRLLLTLVLAFPLWAQTAPQQRNPPNSKSLDELGLQVQDQKSSQSPTGEGTQATQSTATEEKIISPQEAKELFKSVNEIVELASRETKLPIKEQVN